MNYQVMIEKNAHQDIAEIHYYVATNLQVPTIAEKQVARIYNAIGELAKLPLINPKYEKDSLAKYGLRKLVVDNYLVFYTVNEQQKQVVVIMVAYAGRNVEALLKNIK